MKKLLRKMIRKLIGSDEFFQAINKLDEKYNEQVSTIHYFLNNYCDITKFPTEKDLSLFQLQLCDVQLLRIVDNVLRKLQIDYWLDYGTLLGAVRHKGFIPWDDDMDISVVRSDFDYLKTLLPKKLSKYGIEVSIDDSRLGVSYRHTDTGIWLDIFPDDVFYTDKPLEDIKKTFNEKQKVWRSKVLPVFDTLRGEDVEKLKNKTFGFPGKGNNKYYIQAPEMFGKYMRVHHHDTIFPIGHVVFNGYDFLAPYDVETFLINLYGNDYMNFPKSGVLHHDLGRGPLSTWAKRSGTSMEEVYVYLKNIANSL